MNRKCRPCLPVVAWHCSVWSSRPLPLWGRIGGDSGAAIALDAAANVYVAGNTIAAVAGGPVPGANDFPTTAGAFKTISPGDMDAFVMKMVVTVAPAITAHPANQAVTSGQNAQFTVAATGSPAPTYQWQLSTNAGSTWSGVGNGSP